MLQQDNLWALAGLPSRSRVGNGQVGTDLGLRLFSDGIRANGLGTPAHDKTPTHSEGGCRLVRGAAGPSEQLGSLAALQLTSRGGREPDCA
jgi:hypothetical protein